MSLLFALGVMAALAVAPLQVAVDRSLPLTSSGVEAADPARGVASTGPRLRLDLFASDVQPVTLGVGVAWGGLHAQAVLGTGRGSQYVGGLALGVRFGAERFVELSAASLLVQALTQGARGSGRVSLWDFETDLLSQLRLTAGLRLFDVVELFAGVTANYEVSFGPNPVLVPTAAPVLVTLAPPSGGGGHQLWVGALLGVRL